MARSRLRASVPAIVVVGAQWGDEGKGKVTDVLAKDVDVVARYQGGANAGHTVQVAGRTFKFNLLPSGVVQPGKTNVLGNGLVVDPKALLEEMRALEAAGLSTDGIRVSDRAHVILPYHRDLDAASESGTGAIGTTRKGIGPAYQDKAGRVGIRMADLLDRARLRNLLAAALPEKEAVAAFRTGSATRYDLDALVEEYAGYGERLRAHVADTVELLNRAHADGKHILLEGAQGTFLDIDHGTYPYVTSSNTTAGGACAGSGLAPTAITEVIGIVKAYTTRVGAGPFPTELSYDTPEGRHLTDAGAEFGTVTGRRRRVGWLDLVLLSRATMLNGFTAIAITKLDVLGGLPKVRVCTAYRIDGAETRRFPSDSEAFGRAEPVYREFPGFPALGKADVEAAAKGGVSALPKAARDVLDFVEETLDVPIDLVSVGPGREATVSAR